MKKLFTYSLIIGALIFASCNDTTADADELSLSEDSTALDDREDEVDRLMLTEDDEVFAEHAIDNFHFLIALANMATGNTQNETVAAYAKEMIDAHRKINKELTTILLSREENPDANLTEEQEEVLEKLKITPVSEFNRDYMSLSYDVHQNTITLFNTSLENVDDAALKEFIKTTLPDLQQHMERDKEIRDKL